MPQEAPEISPADLVRQLEAGKPFHVLDVRAPFRLAGGRIDVVPDDRFHNIPGSQLTGFDDIEEAGLDRAHPLAVVCGLGNDSKVIAAYLNEQGFDAASVEGGMVAWMEAIVPRELPAPAGCDRLVQFDRVGKGSLCYLLISDGEGFVVDPPRHVVSLLETIDAAGVNVVGVADTHAHADYISGGHALSVVMDAPYRLHPADAISPYDGTPGKVAFEPLAEGQTLEVGRAKITVVHTPGHTEGSVTFRIGDDAALSGDFVFVSSVGRPDLGGKTDAWTPVLFSSLERARRDWPDGLRVYPAHYGSAAERNDDQTIGAPFGELRRSNEPLSLTDGDAFAAWVRARAGAFPDVYQRIKTINLGLETVDDATAEELEAGKNECALG